MYTTILLCSYPQTYSLDTKWVFINRCTLTRPYFWIEIWDSGWTVCELSATVFKTIHLTHFVMGMPFQFFLLSAQSRWALRGDLHQAIHINRWQLSVRAINIPDSDMLRKLHRCKYCQSTLPLYFLPLPSRMH